MRLATLLLLLCNKYLLNVNTSTKHIIVQDQFPPTVVVAEKKCGINGPDANIRTARFTTLYPIALWQFAKIVFVFYTRFLTYKKIFYGKKDEIHTETDPEIVEGGSDTGIIPMFRSTGILHVIPTIVQIVVTVLSMIMQALSICVTARNYGLQKGTDCLLTSACLNIFPDFIL
ncbi:hypothetical protein KIN20_010824 [Parelaphostrongylus tenuis]|uniref:Uncharacterized protein n=1 Tax=Parelaphostrongylus tenuis TaxID=148309 RepID=A0AAD5MSH6_PARTN|nr:hypothetical protein KIN20_010824 [Parelaphostrongylus tenuis]